MSTSENRPPRETPYLKLPVPGDSEPADAHQDIGDLADALDALAAAGGLGVETGDIKMSARPAAPTGWLLCDGSAIDRVVYAALFAAIGVAYGPGDGSTTFNVPDYRDRFPMGAATPAGLGVKGGAATVALTTNEMPYHSHGGQTANDNVDHVHYVSGGTGWNDRDHSHHSPMSGNVPVTQSGGQGAAVMGGAGHDTGGANTPHTHSFSAWSGGANTRHLHGIYAEGGGAGHNNIPPNQGINFFIKT